MRDLIFLRSWTDKFYFAVFSSSTAGALLALIDALFCHVPAKILLETRAEIFAYDLSLGSLVGLLFALLLLVGRPFDKSGNSKYLHDLILSITIIGLFVPVSFKMFSGPGISRSPIAPFAPFVFLALAAVFVWLLISALRKLYRRSLLQRLFAALVFLAASSLAAFLDRSVQPGLYLYLHSSAALLTLIALSLALSLLLKPEWFKGRFLFALVLFWPTIWIFPNSNAQRVWLSENDSFVSRYVYLVDSGHKYVASLQLEKKKEKQQTSLFNEDIEIAGHPLDERPNAVLPNSFFTSANSQHEHNPEVRQLINKAKQFPTVLIFIDALRDDRVGDPQFPILKALADESIRFKNMYAPASSTSIVVPAIAVGHPMARKNEVGVIEFLQSRKIISAFVTNIVALDTLGCKGNDNKTIPNFCSGFSNVDVLNLGNPSTVQWGGGIDTITSEDITRKAMQIINAITTPNILLVHYFDVHQWDKIDDFSGKGPEKYDAAVRYEDAQLAPWYAIRDRINIILFADHGEMLNRKKHKYHTKYLYRELVRVPFLLRIPGVKARVINEPTALVDLAPTLLDLLDLPTKSTAWRARSLLNCLDDKQTAQNAPIAMFERRQVSLLEGHWRFIYQRNEGRWLYDLSQDPDEQLNLADRYPQRCESMLDTLYALRRYYLSSPSTAQLASKTPPKNAASSMADRPAEHPKKAQLHKH